jgi:hypothetical protein
MGLPQNRIRLNANLADWFGWFSAGFFSHEKVKKRKKNNYFIASASCYKSDVMTN